MSRIKGRYVAQLVMEWDQEREKNTFPIEEIKARAKQLSQALKEHLLNEMDASSVEVTEQYCDFCEVDDE